MESSWQRIAKPRETSRRNIREIDRRNVKIWNVLNGLLMTDLNGGNVFVLMLHNELRENRCSWCSQVPNSQRVGDDDDYVLGFSNRFEQKMYYNFQHEKNQICFSKTMRRNILEHAEVRLRRKEISADSKTDSKQSGPMT